jgi:hypothetical protein
LKIRLLPLFAANVEVLDAVDTDPGVDDTVAILLALASPEIEILGYVISFGSLEF